MNLALFDLDNTLLAGDSDFEWAQFLIGKGVLDREVHEATNRAFFEQYKAGTLDIHAFLDFQLAPLARHARTQLDAWHREFMAERIVPLIGAPALATRRPSTTRSEASSALTASPTTAVLVEYAEFSFTDSGVPAATVTGGGGGAAAGAVAAGFGAGAVLTGAAGFAATLAAAACCAASSRSRSSSSSRFASSSCSRAARSAAACSAAAFSAAACSAAAWAARASSAAGAAASGDGVDDPPHAVVPSAISAAIAIVTGDVGLEIFECMGPPGIQMRAAYRGAGRPRHDFSPRPGAGVPPRA